MDELRAKGLAKMNEVYGWEMPNIEGDPYFDLTVDHLFGTIWTCLLYTSPSPRDS